MSSTIADINPIDPSNVKKNDVMAFTMWAQVENVVHNGKCLNLVDLDTGAEFRVEGSDLIQNARSADVYDEEREVTKTELVSILSSAYNVPFTVVFIKANGEKRTLRGRLIGVDKKNLGYLDVEDLDQEENRFRLVDCRNIKSLILSGIKYFID